MNSPEPTEERSQGPEFPKLTFGTYFFVAARTFAADSKHARNDAADPEDRSACTRTEGDTAGQEAFADFAATLYRVTHPCGENRQWVRDTIARQPPESLTVSRSYFALSPVSPCKWAIDCAASPMPQASNKDRGLHLQERSSFSAGTVLDTHYVAIYSAICSGEEGLAATRKDHYALADAATDAAVVRLPFQQLLEFTLAPGQSLSQLHQSLAYSRDECLRSGRAELVLLFDYLLGLDYYQLHGAWVAPPCSGVATPRPGLRESPSAERKLVAELPSDALAGSQDQDPETIPLPFLPYAWIIVHTGTAAPQLFGSTLPLLMAQTAKIHYSRQVVRAIRHRQHLYCNSGRDQSARSGDSGTEVIAQLEASTTDAYELSLLDHSLAACRQNLASFLFAAVKTSAQSPATPSKALSTEPLDSGPLHPLLVTIAALRGQIKGDRDGLQLKIEHLRDRLTMLSLRRQRSMELAQIVVAILGSIVVPFAVLQTLPLQDGQEKTGFVVTSAVSLIILWIVGNLFIKANRQ